MTDTVPGASLASAAPPLSPFAARPLACLAGGFGAGILAGLNFWNCAAGHVLIVGALTACLFVTAGALTLLTVRGRRHSRIVLIVGLFAAIGFWRGQIASSPGPNDPSRWATGRFVQVVGAVDDVPRRTSSGWSFTLSAERIEMGDGRGMRSDGRIAVRTVDFPRSAELLPGDRLTVHGRLGLPEPARNPGGFDERAYLAARSTHATLQARHPSDVTLDAMLQPRPLDAPIARLGFRCRASYSEAMTRLLDGDQAALMTAIAFGGRSGGLPARLADDFARTGTIHVLATAGLHVGIVAMALLFLCRALPLSRRQAAVAVILCLLLYASAAGERAAVMRAAIVLSLALAARVLDREVDGPTLLAAVAVWFLARSPELILDAGFQLSFVTVASILALLGAHRSWSPDAETGETRGRGKRQRMGAWFRDLVLVSIAAQVGSAPLTAEYFHVFSPVSILANILVVPAIYLVLVASFWLWPVALVLPGVAHGLASFTVRPCLWYIIKVVPALAGLPGAQVNVESPGWAIHAAYYALLFGAAYCVSTRRRNRRRLLSPVRSPKVTLVEA